jgi:hypothetical protein
MCTHRIAVPLTDRLGAVLDRRCESWLTRPDSWAALQIAIPAVGFEPILIEALMDQLMDRVGQLSKIGN